MQKSLINKIMANEFKSMAKLVVIFSFALALFLVLQINDKQNFVEDKSMSIGTESAQASTATLAPATVDNIDVNINKEIIIIADEVSEVAEVKSENTELTEVSEVTDESSKITETSEAIELSEITEIKSENAEVAENAQIKEKDSSTIVVADEEALNTEVSEGIVSNETSETVAIVQSVAINNKVVEEDLSLMSLGVSVFSEEEGKNSRIIAPEPFLIEASFERPFETPLETSLEKPLETSLEKPLETIAVALETTETKLPHHRIVQSKVYDSYYELSGFELRNNEKILYGEVEKGDTISALLNTWVTNAQINEAIKVAKPYLNLKNIYLGSPYAIVLDEQNRFKRFEYEVNSQMVLTVYASPIEESESINVLHEYSQYTFTADLVPIEFEIKLELVKGEIKYSLFDAVIAAKAGASLTTRIVDVFAYQIDFFRDIRAGDTFEVLIEKKYNHGKFYGYGDALAMIFVNDGDKYTAYQHRIQDEGFGYYDENGEALESLLLRTPLNYARISSGYSMARKHPILDITRPHQGIDYAAPYGTPVRTVGDGTIKFVGWKGDYGNTVIVTHSNGLESQYAHLSKFATNLKKGSKVRQGQTIAYVGSTGLSTGPHLDYRLRKDGNFINPQSIVIPRAPALAGEEKDAFLQNLATVRAYLDGTKALASYEE